MPFIHTLSKRNQKEYLKNFAFDLKLDHSYFFHGIPGSGKTTKALFFTKKWFEFFKITPDQENSQAKFIRFNYLIDLSKDVFLDGQKGANAREEMREIRNYRFLILDDIGTEKNTEFVDKTVYELINYRFEEELQTIFTSNYSLEIIGKNYHDRISSRIGEVCGKNGIIKLMDVDYRQFSEGFEHSENKLSPSETEELAPKFSLEGKTQEEIDNYNKGRAYFLNKETQILKKF